ncbi:MAG: DNA polymerase IV [Oscillibacter sp.]|nr:DNA polymerase IV [Oscillibacter sp.]
MNQIIIHVDMDAFYASVEIRDNPFLAGKPLIIGSQPTERGVVATCSYEARKYGVRSGMNIKDAYLLCPVGIYMHPNFDKYRAVSQQLHQIWSAYASACEYIALDEAYLDVTERAGTWETAREIAWLIKRRTREEQGLTCSVGVAYSKTAAKTASEEKKPDGYFEIPSARDFVNLILERDVKVLYTVGEKTAGKLNAAGIFTVHDVRRNQEEVIRLLGKQGRWITRLAYGIDDRKVVPYRPEDAKSISREVTFQEDTADFEFLKDVLFLLSLCVENRVARRGLHANGVTLKLTYGNMRSISRSRATRFCNSSVEIYQEAVHMLEQVERQPVRLIGVGVYNLSGEEGRQLTIEELLPFGDGEQQLKDRLDFLRRSYRLDFAGHLEQLYHMETLHKTVEYMRKHPPTR